MQLIRDWRKAWRFRSLQLGVIGTALTSIFLASPEAALYAWALLPEDIKTHIPPEFVKYMGIAILAGSFVARIIKQPKLEKTNEQN